MALDFMAIISNGTTSATSTQRAISAVSGGLLAEAFPVTYHGKDTDVFIMNEVAIRGELNMKVEE